MTETKIESGENTINKLISKLRLWAAAKITVIVVLVAVIVVEPYKTASTFHTAVRRSHAYTARPQIIAQYTNTRRNQSRYIATVRFQSAAFIALVFMAHVSCDFQTRRGRDLDRITTIIVRSRDVLIDTHVTVT